MKLKIAIVAFLFSQILVCPLMAATIRGKIRDNFQEPLTGAYVLLKGHQYYAVAGLDGSFQVEDVKPGTYRVAISFLGYQSHEQEVIIQRDEEIIQLHVELIQDVSQLQEITITGKAEGGSEAEARLTEHTSSNTLNIISAKAISLSPDISVANVVQRVSGLSVERNSNGDPQYAIVRGMDKRYSYTLVNGVKIPSPDNKNRYVPLDIFPASMLERLEVYKSLTANMEGDAIGGAVNMVMKSAPESFEVKGDFQAGYNYINIKDGFDRYNTSTIHKESPREQYGMTYQAQPSDFTKKNLEVKNVNPLPDMLGTISVGNRFLNKRLGVLVGTSFQNSYRGTESIWYESETDRYGTNLPALRLLQERHYSTHQLRLAAHTRLDYRLNKENELKLYAGYFRLVNDEAREIDETYVDGRGYNAGAGDAILGYSTRTRTTRQGILNTTLQGKHRLASFLTADWSAVFSRAAQQRPDNAQFLRSSELKDHVQQAVSVDTRNARQWDHNTDQDYTGYLNFSIQPSSWTTTMINVGSMYRHKTRDSYFNRYLFDPDPGVQEQGVDWNTYSDVTWEIVNPSGSATDELNNKAHENIFAGYGLVKFEILSMEVNAGVRAEHTDQGYVLKTPKEDQRPDSAQQYTDVLPSISLKYRLRENVNLRATYYKAISRPGYFEIVPYKFEDDGNDEGGNPSLKRVKADNFDLRWEYFPSTTDQLLIGAFYKRIQDPIEYAIVLEGTNNEPIIRPGNYGTAYNVGIEVDFCKFFNKIGIKANYTYTHSRITTTKGLRTRVDPNDPSTDLIVKNVKQTRPLQGQADHIGNFSLLYKDVDKGWDAQLSLVYTGERLESISPYLDNDMYAAPITQLDFSIQKRLSDRVEIFAKTMNLINSPYKVYIKKPLLPNETNGTVYPYQDDPKSKTLIRRDQYYQSARVGIRFNF